MIIIGASPAEVLLISNNEQSLNILMVDDNPADGEMVRRHLEDATIPWTTELELALSLNEALSVVPERRVDVLIIDYRFPFGNGFDVLERLRQEGFDAPAVMLTGEGDESVAARAVKHQLQDYIPKGDLTPETLRESLQTILSEHPTGSTPPSETKRSKDRIELGGLHELIPQISDKLRQPEDLRILSLGILYRKSTETLNLESILKRTFREVALEPLTFYRVNQDVVMTLLPEPLSSMFSLKDPSRELLGELREVIDDIISVSEDVDYRSIKGAVTEGKGSYRDPAALLNEIVDKFRHKTEEDGNRLVRVPIPNQP